MLGLQWDKVTRCLDHGLRSFYVSEWLGAIFHLDYPRPTTSLRGEKLVKRSKVDLVEPTSLSDTPEIRNDKGES